MTGGRPTILLADDEPFLRALVRATLGSSYQLIEAEDGAEALDLTRRHQPSVALIDGQMPKIDGFAVCQSLKSDPLTNHIPIIMLTARTSAADRELGAAAGADGYLTKPFSPANLLATVEQALTRADILEVESAELTDVTPMSSPPTPEIAPEEQEQPAETSPELAQILAYARELGSLYESARTHAAHFRQLAEISRELVSARNTGGVIQLALERSTAFAATRAAAY